MVMMCDCCLVSVVECGMVVPLASCHVLPDISCAKLGGVASIPLPLVKGEVIELSPLKQRRSVKLLLKVTCVTTYLVYNAKHK